METSTEFIGATLSYAQLPSQMKEAKISKPKLSKFVLVRFVFPPIKSLLIKQWDDERGIRFFSGIFSISVIITTFQFNDIITTLHCYDISVQRYNRISIAKAYGKISKLRALHSLLSTAFLTEEKGVHIFLAMTNKPSELAKTQNIVSRKSPVEMSTIVEKLQHFRLNNILNC